MKNFLLTSLFLFTIFTLSAQTKTSLVDLLDKPKQSQEVSEFMAKYKDWQKEDFSDRAAFYRSPDGGVEIETVDDTVRSISVYAEGEEAGDFTMHRYMGELPYGLKMNMLRGEVVKLLGEPEVIDGFSESDYAVEMTGSYPSKKIRVYYNVDDNNTGAGWKDPKDKFTSISIGDISEEYNEDGDGE
jgi:hypothetical protein